MQRNAQKFAALQQLYDSEGKKDVFFSAMVKTPAFLAEKEFLSHYYRCYSKRTNFSYRVNAQDKLWNEVIVESLNSLPSHYSGESSPDHFFMSVNEFRTVVLSYKEEEFDYESLSKKIAGNSILCIEDMDLLASLTHKEYKKFLAFLKQHQNKRFFFFGDFRSKAAANLNRMKDFDLVFFIRDVNAEQIQIDEMRILRAVLKNADIKLSNVGDVLDRAWVHFRALHQEERIKDAMINFIEKARFATLGLHDDYVLRRDSFNWLGLTDTAESSVSCCRPQALLKLDGMVGLSNVKLELEQLIAHVLLTKKKVNAGLPVESNNLSFLFLGNPGTGKTTVAKILAQTLRELGVLKKGHLVPAHRGTLIASYIGQTAPLVTETFMSALDGVLFVDEAYALYTADLSLDSYGKEAINTLTLLMSEYAGRISVIFAGYPEEMDYMLNSVNPGLRDRFACKILFEDYTENELWDIFSNKLSAAKLVLEQGGADLIKKRISQACRNKDKQFSNGRMIDNLFQAIVNLQEIRLASAIYKGLQISHSELALLTLDDCAKLLDSKDYMHGRNERQAIGFKASA